MSIKPDRPPVFVEFPNFGLGPATTFLSLAEPIIDAFRWHVVSSGGAADFVRRHLPGAIAIELDTFAAENWPRFCDVVPPGSVVVSVTNPHFAGWAAQCGYRVGVVDTLDWMWGDAPAGIELLQFHLVQHYFGAHTGPGLSTGVRRLVRPVIDPVLWQVAPGPTRRGTAVVGFGGMAVPGRADSIGEYVSWFLSAALPVLVDHAGSNRVIVVGGRYDLPELIPAQWRQCDSIEVFVGMARTSYARLVREAEHVLLAPGLGTLYECAAGRLTPLLQPGFNMSMVMQARDVRAAGYQHVAAWPWLEQTATALSGMTETDGLQMLANLIDQTVLDQNPDDCGVTKALMSYVDRDGHKPLTFADVDLPDGRELLAEYLREVLL